MKTFSVFYCLLYATLTEGTTVNVEGLQGGQVSFQCSHKLARNYNKYFCKNSCKSSDILVTVEAGRRAESGRITLVDSGDGIFTVTFSQLHLSDSQKYFCAVDRPGWDTYTEVCLTVRKATETTTLAVNVSSTWTSQIGTNSTQLTTESEMISPTNLSTSSNFTDRREQSSSKDIILFASVGGFALLSIMILVTCHRKRKALSRPQPAVCSNSSEESNAHKREMDNDYDDIDTVEQCVEKVSVWPPVTTRPPPGSDSLPIYENISFSRIVATSKCSPTKEHSSASRTYISPLPTIISENDTGNALLLKHKNKPVASKNTYHYTCNTSIHSSTGQFNTVRPRSLWFGLDLSAINQQ